MTTSLLSRIATTTASLALIACGPLLMTFTGPQAISARLAVVVAMRDSSEVVMLGTGEGNIV
ncbi:MAG: hypothetical protein EOP83_35880, partial [Verrucomicrobiaceae bacterium]